MESLYKKQGERTRDKIVRFIDEYVNKHGYSPTIREIGAAVGLKSTASVSNHIERLKDEGKIETEGDYNTPRALRVKKDARTKAIEGLNQFRENWCNADKCKGCLFEVGALCRIKAFIKQKGR